MAEWWNRVLEIEGARWIIYPSVLIAIVLVAYYVLQLLRNLAIGAGDVDSDHLGSFRKMRDEGMIAPEEYKKLAELVPMPETESETSATETETPGASKPEPMTLKQAAEAAAKKSAANILSFDEKESAPFDSGESLEP